MLAEAGWLQTSDTEFAIESPTWRDPAERIDARTFALVDAAAEVYAPWFAGLDPTSEASTVASPTASSSTASSEATPEWFTPEIAAVRWEGRAPGS